MIGYLDCSTGVSGDKFLGALLHAGKDGRFTTDHLAAILSELAPGARLVVEPRSSHGISALGVRAEDPSSPPHRTWREIRPLIADAGLADHVRARAMQAFSDLANAEAEVHACSPDDVHFHEVGAIDSILDVVGVCAGLDALGVERLVASPAAVGGGSVRAAHGLLPVPAPATVRLLEGIPTVSGPLHADGTPLGELTTPTGAALLRTCVDEFAAWPAMVPRCIGYGAGTRDIGQPNVCRIVLGEPVAGPIPLSLETVVLLETNIDHLAPEAAAVVAEQLAGEGALDVWISPIVMKKGRAAFLLSALSLPNHAELLASRIAALTGTLGIRRRELDRFVAEREIRCVESPFGPVRVKTGSGRTRPEAADVARIAATHGMPYSAVEAEIGAFLALGEDKG